MLGGEGRGLSNGKSINVLTFSALYPNREMPYKGIFVENRLRHLTSSGEIASLVVAPVPWFPSANPCFGRYATFARVPQEGRRHGIAVLHPRYALIPKIGMASAPVLMYGSLRGACSGSCGSASGSTSSMPTTSIRTAWRRSCSRSAWGSPW